MPNIEDTTTFAALLDEPRWLAWREEERGGRRTKIPYSARGEGLGSATDPATWGTHAEAETRAGELQNGSGNKTGCGIALGNIGDHLFLAGVDLDSSLDENRALPPWAARIISTLATYAEISPSGRGLKALFYLADGDVRWFLDQIGVEPGKWGTKRGVPGLSGADHGPGIEVYTSARYFTVTHRLWSADHPRIAVLDHAQLEALAGLIPPAPERARADSGHNGHGDWNQDTSRSAKALSAARKMGAGSFEQMCNALRRHPDAEIRDWVAEKGESYGGRELRRIWDLISQGEGVRLQDFYAYMPQHNYMFAPARELWPGGSVNARIPPIQVGVDEKGEPILIKASAWIDQNRPVEQMTWAAGLPMIIKDRLISEGGWIKRKKVSVFNLYRAPMLAHGDPGKAGPWIEHVKLIYPDDVDHIIRWLAQRVQQPENKINHALVLSGNQGIGKDTLLAPVKRAVGPWNVGETSPKQMSGQFNGYVKSVILVISEIHDLGEFDRYQFYERTKVYIAAPPDVLRVNEKFLREYYVVNCTGVIITTNHKTDGMYLPADDRRHFVAWSHRDKEDFKQSYWDGLWEFYDSGGDGHVAAYLAQLDLSGFNPKAPPPQTEAFWNIVNANRAPEDAELADLLDELGNPDALTLDCLRAKANELTPEDIESGDYLSPRWSPRSPSFSEWLDDRKNRRIIPHRLESRDYVPVRNPDARDGYWKIGGKRQAVYAKASLSITAQLGAAAALLISTS